MDRPIKTGDMRTDLTNGYYANYMEYPKRPTKPILGRNATSDDALQYAEELKKWEKEILIHKVEMEKWNAENNRVHAEFRADATEYAGLKDHPKADAVWSKAWEHGHSSGFSEVLYWLEDLAELVLD